MTTTNSKCGVNERLSEHEVLEKFKKLRQEQLMLLSELTNAEENLEEKKIAEEALANADVTKKCFYNMNNILIESTPLAILNILLGEKSEVEKEISRLNQELKEKTKQVFEHQMAYNIRVDTKELGMPVRRFFGEF